MPLNQISSDATIKAVKAGDPRRRLSDGSGLYLLLFVKGGSHGWRFDYGLGGRRNTLSLGTYPATGLALARKQADQARRLVREGIDPSGARQEARAESVKKRHAKKLADAGLPAEDSFEAIAREWYIKNRPTWAASHSEKIIRRFERDVFPWIGRKPIASIVPADMLALLRRVEERGPSKRPTACNRSAGRCSDMQSRPIARQAIRRATCVAH